MFFNCHCQFRQRLHRTIACVNATEWFIYTLALGWPVALFLKEKQLYSKESEIGRVNAT
jgi:hypothetical protein